MNSKISPVITLIGLNSGTELQLPVLELIKLMDWYVKEAPKEYRDLNTVLKIARFHDALVSISSNEKNAADKKIEDSTNKLLMEEQLRKESGELESIPLDKDYQFQDDKPLRIIEGAGGTPAKKEFKNIFDDDEEDLNESVIQND